MKIKLKDDFWNKYIYLINDKMIPYQWDILHDRVDIKIDKERDDNRIPDKKSHAVQNLKIAAGFEKGHHYGWPFQDTDVYKWLEAASNTYILRPNEKLFEMINEIVNLIENAQDEDGYISTFYQIDAPELKFRELYESHELYNMGHLIEAAIAHYKATEDYRLIRVSEKVVDCLEKNFGDEVGKINGADGHQEIELALVKLYELTGNERYLKLSEYFLKVRGQNPSFYTEQLEENLQQGLTKEPLPEVNPVYRQAHIPVMEQTDADGHAVRLVYMAAAMADVAYHTDNKELFNTCKNIWNSIVKKRMYITGGIGSTVHGEAFTYDYDLPNDTMYCETCASIGLTFFGLSMLKNESDSSYTDIIERCLYNTIISGTALDGKHFFYVNPLEVSPKASKYDPSKKHVKPTRPSWFGTACCPPNIARTLSSLEKYLYTKKNNQVLINLFLDNTASIELNEGNAILKQNTEFPYNGKVQLDIKMKNNEKLELGIRIPNYSENFKIVRNDEIINPIIKKNYAYINITSSTKFDITFDLPIVKWHSHPKVKSNKGKVAIQRGPFVYCLEEVDNGEDLNLVYLKDDTITENRIQDSDLGDIIILETKGYKEVIKEEWKDSLYRKEDKKEYTEVPLKFVPYHTWANRSLGEMKVWINQKEH